MGHGIEPGCKKSVKPRHCQTRLEEIPPAKAPGVKIRTPLLFLKKKIGR